MYVLVTIAALGVVTGAIVLLRFFWWRAPLKIRAALLTGACVSATLPIFILVTGWETTSDRANTLLRWIAVAGYELILMRFSLMRPQWLTSISAVVLILPIFGASLLLPLTELFHKKHREKFSIGGPYYCERVPWDISGTEVPGVNLIIFYQPRFVPFLQHQIQLTAFNAVECEPSAATASILPGKRQVLFHCPANDGGTSVEHTLPLN